MPRRKTQFEETAALNNITWRMYFDRIRDIALSRFVWSGLPDTVDELYFERKLFGLGAVAFFRDAELTDYLCLPYSYNGRLNVYNKPVSIRAYATNYNYVVDSQNDFSIIYNTMTRQPSVNIAAMFARRLYNIDRIIDVNANNQKTPILILCDEKQRLTMENLYKNVDGGVPRIFGSKDLDLSGITVLPTNAPYISDKLTQLKADYWNELLTWLGISNVSYQKKERMNRDEVSFMQGGSMTSRRVWLQPRETAAEEINRKFGLNVSVAFNSEYVDNSVNNVESEGPDYE